VGGLHLIDVCILAAYLAALAGIGIYFSRRQLKLEDFFLARRGMSWLPVGLSLMAALNSGIDYLMVPSTTIKFGIVILVVNLTWFLLYPYAFFITLPLFRRLQVYSAYEYLEHRFGLGVRGLGALIFLFWRLGWMATALYVPCLAISSVMGRSDLLIPMIVVLGGVVTFSTMLGGIKGVIWTNVMQFCIMFGGLAGTILVAWYHVPGGVSEIAASIFQAGATQSPAPAKTAASLSGPMGQFFGPILDFFAIPMTAVGLFVGVTVSRLATYTSDQVMIQRFQTTRSIRETRQGFLVTAISDVVWMTALAVVGLALFAYLQHNPLPEAIEQSPDQIFPYFMSQVFPAGVTGLVIAAIMAASLGSIAGAINSLTAVAMVDFYKRIWLGRPAQQRPESEREERREVFVSRIVTLAVGVIGTTISCNVAEMGTIFEISNKVINSFTGPLLGIFLLGMFTRRANETGVFCGGFVGTAVTLYTIHLSNLGTVSFLWPSTFGLIATLLVGYLASLAFGTCRSDGRELTFQAIMRQPELAANELST
jgi:SSS family transporter